MTKQYNTYLLINDDQVGGVRILLDCGGRVDTAAGNVRGVATPQHLFGLCKDKEKIDISSIDAILISSYRSIGICNARGLADCMAVAAE